MKIYGVDIGKNGGASCIDIEDTKTIIELLEFCELNSIIKNSSSPFIIMEKIFVSPKMNPQTSIQFGMNKQKAIDFIDNKIYFDVHPRSWQKYIYKEYIEEVTKFKALKEAYNKTIEILGAKVIGTDNDGKRASVLIALYGSFYLLTEGIKSKKFRKEQYQVIEADIENLIHLRKILNKNLISKLSK